MRTKVRKDVIQELLGTWTPPVVAVSLIDHCACVPLELL